MRRTLPFLFALLAPASASAQNAWPGDAVPLSVVESKMGTTKQAVYRCYTEHVPESSRKHGDVVTVRVIASESGKVFRVDFLESSYKSEAFESCAREALTVVDFGVKAAKTTFVQRIGLQNGIENVTYQTPKPAGGVITKETVARRAQKHASKINECYMQVVRTGREIEGQVLTEVVIDQQTGTVQSAKVAKSTLDDSTVESCLLGIVRKLEFPIPGESGLVIVQVPFAFQLGVDE